MYVISGIYKGKKLKGFDIEGTRPTMSRVKESLFATINPYLEDSEVLDLFAGSGALGIEALSNKAKTCVFVDREEIPIRTLKENTKDIKGAIIVKKDYNKYLKETEDRFDIILLDPPYHANYINKSLDIIKEREILKENGIVVCEYEQEKFISPYPLIKEKKYGHKTVSIYKNN